MIKPSCAVLISALCFSPAALWAEDSVVPPAPPVAPTPAPAAPAPSAPVADAPEMSDLEKAIPYGIDLLEKKDYETFFKQFADPAMIEEMVKHGGSVADLAKSVNPRMAEGLLFAFKSLKDLKPKIEDDGKLATYTFPAESVAAHRLPKADMAFHRIGSHWYIKN